MAILVYFVHITIQTKDFDIILGNEISQSVFVKVTNSPLRHLQYRSVLSEEPSPKPRDISASASIEKISQGLYDHKSFVHNNKLKEEKSKDSYHNLHNEDISKTSNRLDISSKYTKYNSIEEQTIGFETQINKNSKEKTDKSVEDFKSDYKEEAIHNVLVDSNYKQETFYSKGLLDKYEISRAFDHHIIEEIDESVSTDDDRKILIKRGALPTAHYFDMQSIEMQDKYIKSSSSENESIKQTNHPKDKEFSNNLNNESIYKLYEHNDDWVEHSKDVQEELSMEKENKFCGRYGKYKKLPDSESEELDLTSKKEEEIQEKQKTLNSHIIKLPNESTNKADAKVSNNEVEKNVKLSTTVFYGELDIYSNIKSNNNYKTNTEESQPVKPIFKPIDNLKHKDKFSIKVKEQEQYSSLHTINKSDEPNIEEDIKLGQGNIKITHPSLIQMEHTLKETEVNEQPSIVDSLLSKEVDELIIKNDSQDKIKHDYLSYINGDKSLMKPEGLVINDQPTTLGTHMTNNPVKSTCKTNEKIFQDKLTDHFELPDTKYENFEETKPTLQDSQSKRQTVILLLNKMKKNPKVFFLKKIKCTT